MSKLLVDDQKKDVASNCSEDLFDKLKISLVSPEKIMSWSYGEVTKSETINYRTFKPEKDGLFCARIFGPIKDYECICGRYKRMRHRGITCEKCGVEIILSKVRRERMGHIKLAAPVAHTWFLRSLPSRIGLFLNISLKNLERVIYFESYIVIKPGITDLNEQDILSEEQYQDAIDKYGEDSFVAGMGAESVLAVIENIDVKQLYEDLKIELKSTRSEIKKRKLIRRIRLLSSFANNPASPAWMIIKILPVIPPELRPLVPLEGGRFATSDLNDLYRRVISRNNRLKRLLELGAPEIIVRNEKRMLQESVDYLLDNSRRNKSVFNSNKKVLKSLSDMLKGKQGRFRQNLLGKRVDYSGRSVIVVGPYLKLHQCGLPKKMALELFKPFIYAKLELYGIASTIKNAKKIVEMEKKEVWDILAEVIKQHPVLLNRAPTLHRLGIQAFEPVLIEGKAIALHPLVCAAFNADFDGDQMAVHVPLSIEAQLEARVLMMSTNNILSPANGKPIIVPTQDIVLGLYYMTMDNDPGEKATKFYSGLSEIEYALDSNIINIHTKIKARVQYIDENNNIFYKIVNTTPGRIKVGNLLPLNYNVSFDVVNKILRKKDTQEIIALIYRYCGQQETVKFCDNIMQLGFHAVTQSGISLGKDDIIIPQDKNELIAKTDAQIKVVHKQYQDGFITYGERYNKIVDAWSVCTDLVAESMMKEMSKVDYNKDQSVNSIYMMIDSGARGSVTQMKQLAGMRGLMTRPDDSIIEAPIISNFKEGLDVDEYFNSTHGARKGLADTALKTANSGYLTRRLVDVAQDCVIINKDCGTDKGLTMKPVVENGEVSVSLYDRILGRYLLDDLIDDDGELIVRAGNIVEEQHMHKINNSNLDHAFVRSVLKCNNKFGVCIKCYGRDLSRGKLVSIGEAVGIIAAQSIGEPGTQLTMQTFHIGGAAQKSIEKSNIESLFDCRIELRNCDYVINNDNKIILSRHASVVFLDNNDRIKSDQKIPYGAKLLCNNDDNVKKGDIIAEWDPYSFPVLSTVSGIAKYEGLKENVSFVEKFDDATGMSIKIVTDKKQSTGNSSKPCIKICDQNGQVIELQKGLKAIYYLSTNAVLSVNDNDKVEAGDIIARTFKDNTKTRDITGGLPRVAELFEARKAKDFAIISDIDGYVEFGKDYKNRRRIIVVDENDSENKFDYVVPKGRSSFVQEGDYIRKGDILVNGCVIPHDILRILGVDALSEYMTREIQDVYRLQGVIINDKHIEVITRQLLQKVEITDRGDTTLLVGEQIDKIDFSIINEEIKKEGGEPAQASPVLQGITRASLQTRSFISAASFQETTRILTEAAINSKTDDLIGLKENVVVGHLIPAGTGITTNNYRKIVKNKKSVLQ